MSRTTAILILLLAAVLEAGGDAIVRKGLHASGTQRTLIFLTGAIVLFAYGWVVNSPPWDFGKLLGIYVVFFFVVAQSISWIFFKQAPTGAVWLGGLLIVSGGAVIAFSNR
jgi:drug/metabolite transporter superfamily protein YnfA